MRVTLLMNFVAPYRVSLLESLREKVGELRVLISVPMERERSWAPEWGTLNVSVQRNIVVNRSYVDTTGFTRKLEMHVPYDTIPRLVAHRPGAVISGELGMRSLQAALYGMFRPSMPLLIWATLSEHSERGWGVWRTRLRRFILGRADGVLVNGESGARYIARFGLPDARIFRINQPVDVARFASEKRQRDDRQNTRLLYCGMLVSRKGLLPFAETLIAWAAAHADRPLEMWWLGGGALLEALRAMPLPANLTFTFLGERSYADLPPVYAQVDMLVFPTLLDEWGLVVNEAMASGLPVLGSIYSQAVEELVVEGHTGWLCDPLASGSMLAAIDRALCTPVDALPAMREAARFRIGTLTPATASAKMWDAIQTVQRLGRRSNNDHEPIIAPHAGSSDDPDPERLGSKRRPV